VYMRTFVIISVVVLFFVSSCGRAETNSSRFYPHNNLVLLCKTWGFLKYYHPEVGIEKINWDSVLISNIDIVRSLKSEDSVKKFFDSFILPCHNNISNKIEVFYDSVFYKNQNINWINDSSAFSKYTISQLNCIYQNSFDFENKYVSRNEWVLNPIFDNDSLFNSILFPDFNTRLLSLFRYWNIINYYYPYKYLIDNSWDSVLETFIPIFMDATDTIDYHLAVCKLTAMINDNHSYTTSKIIEDHYGNRFLPVKFQIIENKTIIVEKYSDSIARLNNLEIGDILLSINKKPIEYIRDSLSYYFSGSNQQSVQHTISFFLSRSTDTSLILDIQRKDSVLAIKSKTYPRLLLSQERKKKLSNKTIDTISNSILYLDLSQLNYSNAESIFSSVLGFKFLILDLRKNCPFILYDLGRTLFAEKTEFFSTLIPQYQKPGLFTFKAGDSIGPDDYNLQHFDGQLILLIDEGTQSIGEFTTMALSMFEKSITIGRSTAGADGNVSAVYLPGNITTIITGIGIYWPDGGITQRCGITPAIEVKSSIESVILGQDDILLAAIKYANNN